METERFEALIDAILAIIITLIVMEIPLPETTSIFSLLELYPDFIAYTISFIICFNVWNYHHNLFSIVNKINSTITWTSALSMMIIGLLPHVTTMIATNFTSFLAQFLFGLIFFITSINFYLVDKLLLRTDKANIALHVAITRRKKTTIITTLIQIIGFILGYLVYPPIILVTCLISLIIILLQKRLFK